MMLLIGNPKYTTQYFSLEEKAFVDPTREISKRFFTAGSFAAYVENETRLPIHLNEYQPVLPDIYPVPARTKWSYKDGVFKKLKKNIRLSEGLSFETCLKNTSRLLKATKGKIAIEISGGLDSSIVIGMLEKLGYEPILIGSVSELYKFRTEKHIQEIIAKKFKKVILTESFALQFTNLLETPAHFLPTYTSLHHSLGANTINLLKEHDVKYIFQGTAFDAMLVEAINNNPNDIRWPTLQDNWTHDYVFAPHGSAYIDIAALTPIKQMLLSLRNGLAQDRQKWWARKFFASVIPPELSNYAYKANFGPLWWDGLLSSAEQITHIVNTASEITGLSVFENFKIQSLFDDMNNGAGRVGFAKLAYANWVYSLFKAGRIQD
jgi:predicted DNA-binding antitoxin AbrB/MazE fold protein